MFNLDPRTGTWTPKPTPRPAERVATAPSSGLNRHGCWWMFSYHWQDGRVRQEYVATLEGFRAFLEEHSGEDPRQEPMGFQTMVEWAEDCKPGAVECFYELHWIIAIDPSEDHNGLLDGLDPAEWERYERLARAAGTFPW